MSAEYCTVKHRRKAEMKEGGKARSLGGRLQQCGLAPSLAVVGHLSDCGTSGVEDQPTNRTRTHVPALFTLAL